MTRDQERAKHAYTCVAEVKESEQKDYKILVNGLGPNILRSGLAATLAFIERDKSGKAVKLLLEHLAGAKIPGLVTKEGKELQGQEIFGHIRGTSMEEYMLITREVLKTTVWFKRAIQGLFTE